MRQHQASLPLTLTQVLPTLDWTQELNHSLLQDAIQMSPLSSRKTEAVLPLVLEKCPSSRQITSTSPVVVNIESDDADNLEILAQWTTPDLASTTATRETTESSVETRDQTCLPTGSSERSLLDSSLALQPPDFTRLTGPAYANLGDYLYFISESVKSQSELILGLEDSGRRQNKLIHQLVEKVEDLSSIKGHPEGSETLSSQPADSQPSERQPEGSKQVSPQPTPAPKETQPTVDTPAPHQPEVTPAPAQSRLYPLISLLNDDINEAEMPKGDTANKTDWSLLVGDSHVKSVKSRKIERKMKGNRLRNPAAASPKEGSALPPARTGQMHDTQKATWPYKSLIVLTPSNNIKNVETLEKKEQFRLPEKTSVDTVTIVEKALEDNETLEKVVIVELPPRADSEKQAELTKYSNFIVKSKVEKSKFNKNITIAKLDALYNHPEKEIFGPASRSWSDGIHLRGRLGSELYTECILTALRSAGLTLPSGNREGTTTTDIIQTLSN